MSFVNNSQPAASVEPTLLPDGELSDSTPWYAIRLISARQMAVASLLKAKGLEVFIPMEYADIEDRQHHLKHVLRPVVRNLLFVRKPSLPVVFQDAIADLPYKISVVRKAAGHRDFYEIPAREMYEFQAMCNPDILIKKYISGAKAKLKEGTLVLVTHGPLKGLQGKLVRSNKQYFLLKEVPGMGVMLKVTRWCCKPL